MVKILSLAEVHSSWKIRVDMLHASQETTISSPFEKTMIKIDGHIDGKSRYLALEY